MEGLLKASETTTYAASTSTTNKQPVAKMHELQGERTVNTIPEAYYASTNIFIWITNDNKLQFSSFLSPIYLFHLIYTKRKSIKGSNFNLLFLNQILLHPSENSSAKIHNERFIMPRYRARPSQLNLHRIIIKDNNLAHPKYIREKSMS